MARSVAFIRAVMVGRQGLTRDALLRAFRDAGAEEPVSHLTTGNVSFRFVGSTRAMQRALELKIANVLGRREPVFIRSIAGRRREILKDPFAAPPLCSRPLTTRNWNTVERIVRKHDP